MRVERALQRAHQVHLDGRLVVLGLLVAQQAEAMLGADRPGEVDDDVVHDAVDGIALLLV